MGRKIRSTEQLSLRIQVFVVTMGSKRECFIANVVSDSNVRLTRATHALLTFESAD
jgi:hypothetical protein